MPKYILSPYYGIYSELANETNGHWEFMYKGKIYMYTCLSVSKNWKSSYTWSDAQVVFVPDDILDGVELTRTTGPRG